MATKAEVLAAINEIVPPRKQLLSEEHRERVLAALPKHRVYSSVITFEVLKSKIKTTRNIVGEVNFSFGEERLKTERARLDILLEIRSEVLKEYRDAAKKRHGVYLYEKNLEKVSSVD